MADDVRDQLAAVLWRLDVPPEPPIPWPEKWADALLLTVQRLTRKAVAAELRDLVDDAQDHGTVDEDWAVSVERIRARADELDPPS